MTFSNNRIPYVSYLPICEVLAAKFGLASQKSLVTNCYDKAFQDYHRGEQIVGLEWDNWMGYMVVAKTPDSESLLHEIADWLLQSSGWATG